MKTVFINQPAGIGDIFFCQKIACSFINKGHGIVWPVISEFLPTVRYISNGINFIDINSDFPHKKEFHQTKIIREIGEDIILPLRYADLSFSGSMMDAKYKMADIPFEDWPIYFNFHRNKEKESYLYHDILKLNDDEPYIFINENYGSPPNPARRGIKIGSDKKKVYMDFYPDITLFDWIRVFENSSEIHTVETALNYIVEVTPIQSKLFMYPKLPHNHFNYISHLFKKPWIYKQ